MTEAPYQPPGCERVEIDERGVVASATFEEPARLLSVQFNDRTEWLVLKIAGHRRNGVYQPASLCSCEIIDVEAESSVPGEFIYVVRPVLTFPIQRVKVR